MELWEIWRKLRRRVLNVYLYKVIHIYVGKLDCELLETKCPYGSEDFKEESSYQIPQRFHGNNMVTTFEQVLIEVLRPVIL
jgi:hypothetical protein